MLISNMNYSRFSFLFDTPINNDYRLYYQYLVTLKVIRVLYVVIY
jgi:hypothetical protein